MDTTQLQKEKLSHLKALIALECADSRIDLSEHEMIKIVMEREGLTHEDYNRCLHAPESIELAPPTDDSIKQLYLTDMIVLMMADSDYADSEIALCHQAAKMLGFPTEKIYAVVENALETLRHK